MTIDSDTIMRAIATSIDCGESAVSFHVRDDFMRSVVPFIYEVPCMDVAHAAFVVSWNVLDKNALVGLAVNGEILFGPDIVTWMCEYVGDHTKALELTARMCADSVKAVMAGLAVADAPCHPVSVIPFAIAKRGDEWCAFKNAKTENKASTPTVTRSQPSMN